MPAYRVRTMEHSLLITGKRHRHDKGTGLTVLSRGAEAKREAAVFVKVLVHDMSPDVLYYVKQLIAEADEIDRKRDAKEITSEEFVKLRREFNQKLNDLSASQVINGL